MPLELFIEIVDNRNSRLNLFENNSVFLNGFFYTFL